MTISTKNELLTLLKGATFLASGGGGPFAFAKTIVESYFHAKGVTLGAEPGGLLSKPPQEAQNAVLGDAGTPFRFYFIADGKSIAATYDDAEVIAETQKLLNWGEGMTALIVEQDISKALAVSSRVYCLQEGRVSLQGRTDDISRDDITRAYFGVSD